MGKKDCEMFKFCFIKFLLHKKVNKVATNKKVRKNKSK